MPLKQNAMGLALAALLGALCLFAPTAHAERLPYGELTRFGELGNGPGQISGQERRGTGEPRLHLLGADPSDNSVYVLDEPVEYQQKHKTPTKEEKEECEELEIPLSECGPTFGPLKRTFRLQKFTAREGAYRVAASVQFEQEAPEPLDNEHLGIEGIAVDSARRRVYLLAVDERSGALKVDRASRSRSGSTTSLAVASTLYAFSTEGLAPLGKPGKRKGETTPVLAGPGPGELEAQSEAPGKALLGPGGITVDPETGEVIVLAHEDPSGAEYDQLYPSREGPPSPGHFILQRILPSGERVSGEAGRWVDRGNFFKNESLQRPLEPNSPVVVGAAGTEQLELVYEGGIVSLADNFGAKPQPQTRYEPPVQKAAAEVGVRMPETGPESHLGGALSATPFGPEGYVVYAPTSVKNELPKVGGSATGAVMALPNTNASELGWVGGQVLEVPRLPSEEHDLCVLEPGGSEFFTPVAAGSGGNVFVLVSEYIDEIGGERLYTGPAYPAVVELGPGGKGCPAATPGGIAAEINGETLGNRQVLPGETVTISSYINQADALKVEWDFGDGTHETITNQFACQAHVVPEEDHLFAEDALQCPTVRHAFVRGGADTVTEKVYTDNLTTPTVTLQTAVHVAGGEGGGEEEKEKEGEGGGGTSVRAVATGPLQVELGQEALFDGKFSSDPAGPNQITEYHWVFGDGQQATTGSPTILHTYTALGAYQVALTVTDAQGAKSARTTLPHPVLVVPPQPSQPIVSGLQSSAPPPAAAAAGYGPAGPPARLPAVTLSSAELSVSPSGVVSLLLYCPAGEPSCLGTVTLRATIASAGRRGKHPRSKLVTLAKGGFALAGGQRKRVSLQLGASARAALLRQRKLIARLSILAHDPAGATHAANLPVLLRLSSRAGSHSHSH